MPTPAAISQRIADFMTRHFLFTFDQVTVTATTNLFESGHLDSFGFVELITFLEQEFAITFSDDDLLGSRLTSLASFVAIVQEKQRCAP